MGEELDNLECSRLPVYQISGATLYIIVQILHKFSAHVTKLKFLVTIRRMDSKQGNNSTIMMKIQERK